MSRVEGKVVIVTGAAGGMGASHAKALVREGARLIATDRVAEPGELLEAALGDDLRYEQLDVSDEAAWNRVVGETVERWGTVDVLVNNAGYFRPRNLEDETVDGFLTSIMVNQVGAFLGMREVLDPMTRAGGGSIINVSSVAGVRGQAQASAYAATKFAIRGLTKSAAMELADRRIRVNTVLPGVIATPPVRKMPADVQETMRNLSPLGRMGEPEEVSGVVVFLASDESAYCTGGDFFVDGYLPR